MSKFEQRMDCLLYNNIDCSCFRRGKANLDDGCNPELVQGARFDGIMEIPFIEKPSEIKIPKVIVPFSKRKNLKHDCKQEAQLGFNEFDNKFFRLIKDPSKYVGELKEYKGIISPDCSNYRDAPLIVQALNTYRNRAIGSYFQRQGIYVIPQVRWGSEDTYTTNVLPEKVAFLGVEKYSIVAIGTYGCIQHREDKYYFKAGLESMLVTLEPTVVLVYGTMPDSIFADYLRYTQFVQYDNWTKKMHGGNK